MDKAPRVLPILGVIAARGVSPEEVLRTTDAELFENGPRTETVPFDFTDYYREEMGTGLTRFWCAGVRLVPATALAGYKLASVALEKRWRNDGGRRVNLDPGYVSTLQVVLATTKGLPQAIYVAKGIYALVELIYRDGAFRSLPWTYPDYRKAAARGLFEPFRAHLLKLTRETED